MNTDEEFVRRLQEIADTAPHITVRPERVWKGRRQRRLVQAGGGGLAVLLAVAIATTAALGSPSARHAAPPSDEGAATWPAVTVARDGFACGSVVPAINDPPGSDDLHMELLLSVATQGGGGATSSDDRLLTTGAVLTPSDLSSGQATIVNGSPFTLEAGHRHWFPATIWFVRDGAVVGSASPPISDTIALYPTPARWEPGDTLSLPAGGELKPCDGAAELTAGEYDLYVTQDLTTWPRQFLVFPEDSFDPEYPLVAEYFLTLVGGPWSVRLA